MEPTPAGRLVAVARAEVYRHFTTGRRYPPDYADLLGVLERPVEIEILAAKLEEARLKPANGPRVKELLTQLANLAR
jgi:hypothetical protein